MGSRRIRPTDAEETPVEDEEIQEIREAVLALELLAEEALAEKGLLDRDIDSLSEEEREQLSEPEVSALVWRGHVRLFPEWEAFREGGEFRGMSPRAHLAAHCLVEAMLKGPESPYRVHLAELMGRGESRHQAVHELGRISLEALWEIGHGTVH